MVFTSSMNLCCSQSTDSFTNLGLSIESLMMVHTFKESVVLRADVSNTLGLQSDNLVSNRLYSYNVSSGHVDSINVATGPYIIFDHKLNDSLFVLSYFTEKTTDLINNYVLRNSLHGKSHESLLDSTITISEKVLIFNSKLNRVDSSEVSYVTTLGSFRNAYSGFLKYATRRQFGSVFSIFSQSFNLPIMAKSYNELLKKYSVVFKYGNFWCRQIVSKKRASCIENRRLPDNYWNIIFNNNSGKTNEYSNPYINYLLPQCEAEQVCYMNYYWSDNVFFKDTAKGQHDYLVMGNHEKNELVLGRKTLLFEYDKETNNNVESFDLIYLNVEDGKLLQSHIDLSNNYPVTVYSGSNGNLLFNAINRDSVSKIKREMSKDLYSDRSLNEPSIFDYWSLRTQTAIDINTSKSEKNCFAGRITYGNDMYGYIENEVFKIKNDGNLVESFKPLESSFLLKNISNFTITDNYIFCHLYNSKENNQFYIKK